MDQSFIKERFRDIKEYHRYVDYINDSLCFFKESGLPYKQLKKEIFSKQKTIFFQRLWEINLAFFLWDQGFDIKSTTKGPDFSIEIDGKTMWIEAVSPEPINIPVNEGPGVFSVPFEERLLRITSSILYKKQRYDDYIKDGIISSNDICVIAVDCSQLGSFADIGISQASSVLDAVYPVGPMQIHIDKSTMKTVKTDHVFQDEAFKKNGKSIISVPKAPFFVGAYPNVSAVIGAFGGYYGVERISLVHNYTTPRKMYPKMLQFDKEYVPHVKNGELIIENIYDV